MRALALFVAAVSCVAAHAAEPAVRASATDLALEIVKLDPPSGSTLKAGEPVIATVAWRYAKPATHVGVWLKLDLPDASPDFTYEADHGETRPGTGRLERGVAINVPGHVSTLVLVAKDAGSREIFRQRVAVDYTVVASAAQESLKKDGLGSRITGVSLDPSSPARLAPGTPVIVRIGYDARSEHGIGPSVQPVTDCPMTYRGYDLVDGLGTQAQWFKVGTPCVVRQLRVQLVNTGRVVVDERLVDVDLRYER